MKLTEIYSGLNESADEYVNTVAEIADLLSKLENKMRELVEDEDFYNRLRNEDELEDMIEIVETLNSDYQDWKDLQN